MRAFFSTHTRLLYSLTAVLMLFAVLQVSTNFFFLDGFTHGFDACHLSYFSFTPKPYHCFSICLGALAHPAFLFPLLILYAVILQQKISFSFTYENASPIRWLVLICAATLTWELITYDYNYYLNSAFHTDRILLLVITLLLWRYPLLVPLFISFVLVYRSQFNYPIGSFSLVDKRMLIDILLVFTAWNILRKYFTLTSVHLLVLVFSLVASNYVVTALTKIFISPHGYDWMMHNNLADFFYNACSRGWMKNASHDTINGIGSFLNDWSILLQWTVFFIELSMLFVLWRRKMAIGLLLFCLLMHTGIFITGSMLFWKWMVVDIALIAFLFFKPAWITNLFTPVYFRISLGIILLSVIWLRPTRIGWHDTPYNQFFTFEVTDAEGKKYMLSRNDFEPYHQWFQLDAFTWMVNEPTLMVSGFGYTARYSQATEIKKAGLHGILLLVKKQGKNRFSNNLRKEFCHFIQTFFTNYNHRLHEPRPLWYYLHAPHHLYSSAHGKLYNRQATIRQVRVFFVQTWRQENHLITLSHKTCEVIYIPIQR